VDAFWNSRGLQLTVVANLVLAHHRVEYSAILLDAPGLSDDVVGGEIACAAAATMHLTMSLLLQVVCDVWYLEPQKQRENENPIEFSARVKDHICTQAGLINVSLCCLLLVFCFVCTYRAGGVGVTGRV
jgi:hypothetical protein